MLNSKFSHNNIKAMPCQLMDIYGTWQIKKA